MKKKLKEVLLSFAIVILITSCLYSIFFCTEIKTKKKSTEKKILIIPKIIGFDYISSKKIKEKGKIKIIFSYRHKKTGMDFVLIPEGKYYVKADDLKSAKVFLNSYLIGKTEVTQKTWQKFMKTQPWLKDPEPKRGDNFPAIYVNWYDCMKFCKKTNLRLPTEVEWEVACRSGRKTKYFWGDSPSQANKFSWYDKNSEDYAYHEVMKKFPNPYGLYDMTGNVGEWCFDGANDFKYPSSLHNPQGEKFSDHGSKIVRRGSFKSSIDQCMSGYRIAYLPYCKREYIGFRVAYSVKFVKKR